MHMLANKLSSEINSIKKWFSHICCEKDYIHQALNTTDESTNTAELPGVLPIYVHMPY